jgi:anti-sigma28 factor (negative regulator of flagellin synthesis)
MREDPVLTNHREKFEARNKGGVGSINILPADNYRLLAHRTNTMLPRGSDSRHIIQNRVEQIRHHIANDKIKVDRPLG